MPSNVCRGTTNPPTPNAATRRAEQTAGAGAVCASRAADVVQITRVLELVPAPMLLLFKMNDCLRHAERQLDAGVDSFVITLRHCLRTMLHDDERPDADRRAHGLRARLYRLRLRIAYWLLRVYTEGGAPSRLLQFLAREREPRGVAAAAPAK
jgi:hypothetical protein